MRQNPNKKHRPKGGGMPLWLDGLMRALRMGLRGVCGAVREGGPGGGYLEWQGKEPYLAYHSAQGPPPFLHGEQRPGHIPAWPVSKTAPRAGQSCSELHESRKECVAAGCVAPRLSSLGCMGPAAVPWLPQWPLQALQCRKCSPLGHVSSIQTAPVQ